MFEVEQREYVAQMEDIKRRLDAIPALRANSDVFLGSVPLIVVAETIYLQFRKVLELVAMASLLANREAVEAAVRSRKKVKKLWNGEQILKTIERINPGFFPQPIIETPSDRAGVKNELKPKRDGFLTRPQFSELYNLCGTLLHADNPLGGATDYQQLLCDGPMWKTRIMELLTCHQIRLVGHDGFFLVHMHEKRDGRVHIYQFERLRSHAG